MAAPAIIAKNSHMNVSQSLKDNSAGTNLLITEDNDAGDESPK